jgi:arylsulfatase A-like enzyme
MRNVVLVCLDTVRKDYFDKYAPRLRERADVEFAQCRAGSGWSVPSHATMMTGRLPHQHGIHVYNRDFSSLTRDDTFLGRLPDHRAIGASANVYASSAFGFDGIFDEYVSISADRRFSQGMDVEQWGQQCDESGLSRYVVFVQAALGHDHPLHSLANGALAELKHRFDEWPIPNPLDDGAKIVAREATRIAQESREPFICFTNFMDAHSPLTHVRGYDRKFHDAPLSWHSGEFSTHAVNTEGIEGHEEDIEYTRGLYAASIDYLDRQVSEFIDAVQAATDRETTFVITADHGENMGFEADDYLMAHKGPLTEGLLHVPQVVVNAPETVGELTDYVSHLSLGDLVVGLANGEVPTVTRDRIPAERIGSNMAAAASAEEREQWDRMIRVIYQGTDKYVWNSSGLRERKRLDPDRPNWEELAETNIDVAAYEREFFDVPLGKYKRKARAAADDLDVDAATEDRLRNLGYL